MAPMLLFRIENASLLGPFTDSNTQVIGRNFCLPIPQNDGIDCDECLHNDHRFAFTAQHKIAQWFSPADCELMRKHGFHGAVLMVPVGAIVFGNEQVAFLNHAAVRCNTFPL